MKRIKKLTALLLAAAMAFAAAACSGGTASSTGGGGTSTGGDEGSGSSAPVPISWLTTGDSAAEPIQDGDRIIAEINSRLGIELSVQIVPEGNVEKVNVAMAAGEYPDVVTGSYGISATQGWIDNGMVVELNQFFDDNPDMKAWIEEDYPWSAIDGKYYGVPFITQYNAANTLLITRQDWLDNLGLSYPKTLEEMRTVLEAFTNGDPDGNGQNDTVGYTAEKPASGSTGFDWVFFAYGREYADYALDDSGNVIPWFEDDGFVPAMTYIKDLWDSGFVDKELMLNDSTKKEEKFYQGRVGFIPATLYRHVSRQENSLQELNPDATIVYDLPPAGEDGSFGLNKQGKSGMFTCITAACQNQAKAAEFINFMVSEEGNDLLRLGLEGIHYTKDGDTITYNEEERAKDAFSPDGWAHALAWGSFYWPLESGYMPETEPNKERALETVELATEAQVPNLVKQKTPLEIENGSALEDIFIQYFSDMLQGKIGIEEGAAELSQKWRSQGGEEMLAEVQAAYEAQDSEE